MNKLLHPSNLLFWVVVGFCLAIAGAQPQQTADEQLAVGDARLGEGASRSDVGREDPFAQLPKKVEPSAASDTNGIEESTPELFVETITFKSLDAESFRSLIADASSQYGSVSVDKNSNTLIIYDTKEALARIMKLVPQKEVVTENLVHRSYRIVYANVDEVEKTLKAFISKSGNLSANPSTGNILVVDFESNIKVIDNFIKEIDRLMQQVMVEVRIYDVTATEGFDIGAEWDVGRNNPITSLTHTNTRGIVDTVDTVTPTNTGTVTTDTDTTTKTTATAWQDSAAGVATSNYTYRKSKPFVGGSFDADTAGTIRVGLLDTVNLDLALNILRTQVGAKLLANPRILVLDNETAEFKIISEIPYTQQSDTSQGGQLTSTQFKEVGVELKVTPHVTRDGMIRLHIMPSFSVVSELGSIVPDSGGLRGVPTIDNREVDTKALVRDGQTVVLGGLRKREVSQDVSKIPLLGDIPLLGALFTEVSESVGTNELLIFITPRIVTEPTLSSNELKSLEATEFGGPKVPYTGDEKAEKSEKQPQAVAPTP